MNPVCSFPPCAGGDALVLILGSMPGKASLEADEYYAHPRNAFWPVMEALFGIGRHLTYRERLAALVRSRVALWDVLASCVRPGSLDSDIVKDTVVPNDLPGFLRSHPMIAAVFFNGSKAEQAWRRHIAPALPQAGLRLVRLPSTSPANARLNLEEKIEAWRTVSEAALGKGIR